MTFCDMEFEDSRLAAKYSNLKWKRPHEIAHLAAIKISKNPSKALQGAFDNCWLISAFACVSQPHNWRQVFQDNNCLNPQSGESYDGRVVLKLWFNNKFIDVEIDDRLPVIEDGDDYKLIGAYCEDRLEFWASLLEKACAKHLGSYCCLESGQVSNGFMLLAGGFTWTEMLTPHKQLVNINNLENKIKMGKLNGGFVFFSSTNVQRSKVFDNNHYYEIKCADKNRVEIETTWKNFKNKKCSIKDLYEISATITFCAMKLGEIFHVACNTVLCSKIVYDKWIPLESSGGSFNSATYCKNPRYGIRLNIDKTQIVFIDLIQNPEVKDFIANQAMNLHVVVKPTNHKYCNKSYLFQKHLSIVIPLSFHTHGLNAYELVITPSTYECNINASFMLRITAFSHFDIEKLSKVQHNCENIVKVLHDK